MLMCMRLRDKKKMNSRSSNFYIIEDFFPYLTSFELLYKENKKLFAGQKKGIEEEKLFLASHSHNKHLKNRKKYEPFETELPIPLKRFSFS